MSTAAATDWEKVFEDPKSGLIARIEGAKNNANLPDICCAVVEKLYKRRDDARLRDRYRDKITQIFDADRPTDDKLAETVAILREIKQDRIIRAGKKRKARSLEQTLQEYDDTAAQLFADLVLEELQNVLDLLSDGIKPVAKRPLPYFVSPAFGDHFKEIVRTDFMPELQIFNRREIAAAEDLPPNERAAALKQAFEELQFREKFFSAWKHVWSNLTEQHAPPDKPERKRQGFMESLKSQLLGDPEFDDSMTIEEWQEAVALNTKRNEKAKAIWARIAAPSDDYVAPTDAERDFLGGLIVHPYEETQQTIEKLTQMATDKAPASVFTKFQDGKDIDLALLLASMRYPKLFIAGNGGYLKEIMRGFKPGERRLLFPRVDQYLFDEAADKAAAKKESGPTSFRVSLK
ncbi:MAG: hypothetical protein JJ900_09910 [Rhodospirillales bacterium]|nr:hypothetical protein [Rhodospirillales bacterium]MBO6787154.1 hypothetical protein [Rhodospirillales bacterium]